MSLPATPDVLVIGGGVIGCAAARALAAGGRHVLGVDRGALGGEASSAAAGVLAAASGEDDGARLALRQASLMRFPVLAAALAEETGIDVELDQDGVLRLCRDEAEEAAQRARVAQRRVQGLAAEWLDAPALRDAEPAVDPAMRGAGFYPHDGRIACERLIDALVASARRRGAHLVSGAAVRAVERRGDRVARVRIGATWVTPGTVVLAAGAWSAQIPDLTPSLGVIPARGQMLALRPPKRVIHRVLFHGDGCLTPRRAGEVLAGGTVELAGFDKAVTPTGVRTLLGDVQRIAPAGVDWALVRLWAGLRPFLPAGGPLIGRHPELENLVVATGHYRNGILLAPITADAVAALIAGESPPVEVRDFGLPAAP